MRLADIKLVKLVEKSELKMVSAHYLQISYTALGNRLRRMRIRIEYTQLLLNWMRAQQAKKGLRKILTPTPREQQIARLKYEEGIENIENEIAKGAKIE